MPDLQASPPQELSSAKRGGWNVTFTSRRLYPQIEQALTIACFASERDIAKRVGGGVLLIAERPRCIMVRRQVRRHEGGPSHHRPRRWVAFGQQVSVLKRIDGPQ